jgi:hypothetical protein
LTGQVVAFASTSTATGDNNRVGFQVWDLDHDGKFNDASGTTAARWFTTAGVYPISLRANDTHGHSSVATLSVTPARRLTHTASLDFDATANGSKAFRFRRLEHRLLRRGVVLKVLVTRAGTVGKYVRFRIRRHRPPLRTDSCMMLGTTAPVACPSQ